MVFSGGTSRRSAPSGKRRCGMEYSHRSGFFQLSRAVHTWVRQALCPGFWRQSTVAFWKNSCYHLVTVPEPFAPGNLDTAGYSFCATLGSTVDTSSSTAFGRISSVFFVKVSSDPEVDSRPAFLGFSGRAVWRSAQSLLRLRGLPDIMALGIWTLFSRAPPR